MSKTLPERRRDAILAYGKTLPQQKTSYCVKSYEDIYFNLYLSDFEIVANNDAEAVVILNDYLNKNLQTSLYPYYQFEHSVAEFVYSEFNNRTLWLERKPQLTILTLSP